ncbi:MAG: GntR family transcriptional regulator [Paenibacillus sp.]|nr:GntR family transcriptional regulator [Paenibacillus sp.]
MQMRGRPTDEQFRHKMDLMISHLKTGIMEKKFAIGEYLPSEKALSKQFGLGNLSVRKGLEQLADDGWIEKVPNVGNRVITSRTTVTLTVGCNETTIRNAALPKLMEDFKRICPWINVQIKLFSSGSLPFHMQGSPEYDLLLLSVLDFQMLGLDNKADMLETLPANKRMYPILNRLFMHEGQQRMQPIIFSPIVLCYNRRHFREKGLAEPTGAWTWDDLVRHAELLTDGERYGFCFHLPDTNRWPIFLLQSAIAVRGEKLTKESGDRESFLACVRLCKSIVHNRKVFPMYMSEGNEDISKMFQQGKLSMVISSYMGMNVWRDSGIAFDVAPLPFISEPRTFVLATGAGISSSSTRKEEAGAFLDYMTSERAQSLLRCHSFSIPAMQTAEAPVGETGCLPTPDRYAMFREIMFSYRTHADLPIPLTALAPMTTYLKAYWADMISEQELLEKLDTCLTE